MAAASAAPASSSSSASASASILTNVKAVTDEDNKHGVYACKIRWIDEANNQCAVHWEGFPETQNSIVDLKDVGLSARYEYDSADRFQWVYPKNAQKSPDDTTNVVEMSKEHSDLLELTFQLWLKNNKDHSYSYQGLVNKREGCDKDYHFRVDFNEKGFAWQRCHETGSGRCVWREPRYEDDKRVLSAKQLQQFYRDVRLQKELAKETANGGGKILKRLREKKDKTIAEEKENAKRVKLNEERRNRMLARGGDGGGSASSSSSSSSSSAAIAVPSTAAADADADSSDVVDNNCCQCTDPTCPCFSS